MRRVHIFIRGIVQGVFFCAHIQKRAVELDLTGFVQNIDDGSVEAIFEGDEEDIEEMLEFCNEGPRGAQVDDVELFEEEYEDEFENFEVRH
jgi:acylphosphatase